MLLSRSFCVILMRPASARLFSPACFHIYYQPSTLQKHFFSSWELRKKVERNLFCRICIILWWSLFYSDSLIKNCLFSPYTLLQVCLVTHAHLLLFDVGAPCLIIIVIMIQPWWWGWSSWSCWWWILALPCLLTLVLMQWYKFLWETIFLYAKTFLELSASRKLEKLSIWPNIVNSLKKLHVFF